MAMKPVDALTDFGSVRLPRRENELSRRYLEMVMRWIPVGMRYYNDWDGRRDCGHFFGGVLWYGQDTAFPVAAIAAAASSSEFDERKAGFSVDELRSICLKGLRYLCFTHDTGPADCIRPEKSWGRPEPAGRKWGERGRGFFPESQCGRVIAELGTTAALIKELLGDEEKEMLANIAADYMERFEGVEPRSGVFDDTQTEENGWTALGIAACITLLPRHDKAGLWRERLKLWMFRTMTLPRDRSDHAVFAEGKTVADWAGRCYTTLPDHTAENHGFVHPNYMASGLSLSAGTIALLELFGHDVPPHIYWHRRECYELLKCWCDDSGCPQAPQGMDWPYIAYQVWCFFHAAANHYLQDPDAALLEQRALAVLEKASVAHGGRMVPESTTEYCHGVQDPAIMRERMIVTVAHTYLLHRMRGGAQKPSEPEDLEKRAGGVHVYPHAGIVLHRHEQGITSLSWRNRTMILPRPREGLKLMGPAAGSMLATASVRGKSENTEHVHLRIREAGDRVAVLLVEDLAERSLRRMVLFASLPGGRSLSAERIVALERVEVQGVTQGSLSIMNDGYFGEHPDLRGRRRLFWEQGERVFEGFPTESPENDLELALTPSRWVNVEDRFGIVFQGTGRAVYRNPHYFPLWHAVEDQLILSLQDERRVFEAGDIVSELTALCCPGSAHEQTECERLTVHSQQPEVLAVEVDGYFCAGNFGQRAAELPVKVRLSGEEPVAIAPGLSALAKVGTEVKLQLEGLQPVIVQTDR